MGTAVSSYDTFINNLNMHGNNSTVANGASSAGASAYDYVGKVLSTTLKLNGAGANVAGSFDSALGVAQVTTGASSFANANQFVFGNGAKFLLSSTGQLAYSTTAVVAPVPEADTWAMMAAGLGLMGFIGRRRMKA